MVEEKRVICRLCGYKFAGQMELTRHIISFHTGMIRRGAGGEHVSSAHRAEKARS